jgi:hypothetical protein
VNSRDRRPNPRIATQHCAIVEAPDSGNAKELVWEKLLMLTDIFARRYEQSRMWDTFSEEPRRLLVQGCQLLNDVCPYYVDGKESGKEFWTRRHDLLARELGLKELSPRYWGFHNKQDQWQSGPYTTAQMCETWMLQAFDGKISADRFIKERLSLVEIGFRQHENFLAGWNAKLADSIAIAEMFDQTLDQRGGLRVPGKSADGVRLENVNAKAKFQNAVNELNARFRQANCRLHYHNGFIQISEDQTVAQEIETPFWKLVAQPKWHNVDHDMKEAIDLRDTGGRDPARYAAHSLESTIKIISDEKQLTKGNEKGAHNCIDNLMSAKLIEVWEMQALKHFFTNVRNPIGHGPGTAPMPSLTDHQTNWAIENSMIWIKSLIRRM